MEVFGLLGFLVFLGSLIYLVYHFIRARKNKERTLNKKKFYPVLIGGFLLFVIGMSLSDTGIQKELNEALDKNVVLATKNKEMQSTNTKLEDDNENLKDNLDKATKELDELTLRFADFDKVEQELKDLQATHKEKAVASEKEITDLKAANSSLTSEVDSLKKQVASNDTGSSASGSSSSGSSSASSSESGGSVHYKNCTEARAAGAAPVHRGDPGYAKHLDRDGDGIGCE